ncbi:hypothetical protein COCVIDRAFT_98038, partial [Bipolaris victoriae FI3]
TWVICLFFFKSKTRKLSTMSQKFTSFLANVRFLSSAYLLLPLLSFLPATRLSSALVASYSGIYPFHSPSSSSFRPPPVLLSPQKIGGGTARIGVIE